MTDHLQDLISAEPRVKSDAVVFRHLVNTQKSLIENATIPVTCHTYSNGGEVWVADLYPHVTGYSETQLVARLRDLGLIAIDGDTNPAKTAMDYAFDDDDAVKLLTELAKVHPLGYMMCASTRANRITLTLKSRGLIIESEHNGLDALVCITDLGIKELTQRFPNAIKEDA